MGAPAILEGRPYGKECARTSSKQVRAFLGQQRREGARYSGKFPRCNPPDRTLARLRKLRGDLTMTELTVTLAAAAAAAVLNIWLSIRIGAVRRALSISVGDGGNESLERRMRAQANFVENTPFVLVLIAAIELAGAGGGWLAYVAAAYFVGRVLHGFGMDGGNWSWGRMVGTLVTMLVLLGLAVVAALAAAGVM
jgi:uncharacterized membrane protein YecN with MAPEG domain